MTSYAGQRCDAIKHIFVEVPAYDEIKRLLVAELHRIKVGDPRDPDTNMEPLLDQSAATAIQDAARDAVSKGAKVLTYEDAFRANHVD